MNGEHAETFNPAGISYDDAIRALRRSGYTDSHISSLIEVVGDDQWGHSLWRWRTDYHHRWEHEGPARRPVAELR